MSSSPELALDSNTALRVRNLTAAAAVVGLSCAIYALAPYNRAQMDGPFGAAVFLFSGRAFLFSAAGLYVLLLAAYYLAAAHSEPSKSLRFFALAVDFLRAPVTAVRRGVSPADRLALLATLLKIFFGPFMAMALMQHVLGLLGNGWAILTGQDAGLGLLALFNRHGFWFAMQLILFFDVAFFTAGYLVEMPKLGNEIRSVDPTWLGWMAALLCYPPFNSITAAIIGSTVSDFPQFDSPLAHIALNLMLLLLMALYASASVALGLKASNLTHRGIVACGPYALVRHPAYVAKNMAWWIASIPLVSSALAHSIVAGLTAMASVLGWSLIYVLRAVTEEDHLRSVDGAYAAYAAKVRYRFIPGLL